MIQPVAIPLVPWRVDSEGWHRLDRTLTHPAILVVGATSAAEAVVKAVATISEMYLKGSTAQVVQLKVTPAGKRPGWLVDVVVEHDTRGRRPNALCSITAWTDRVELPPDPANAPS